MVHICPTCLNLGKLGLTWQHLDQSARVLRGFGSRSMPRKTVPQRAKAPASAAQPAGNKSKKIDSGIFKVGWLQVPTDAVLKVDLGALMLVPAADDQGFTAGKGMLFAPDTYVSRQKHQYEFLKDAGSVKVGAGYGLQLHGDEETDYFCEGLLDNDG